MCPKPTDDVKSLFYYGLRNIREAGQRKVWTTNDAFVNAMERYYTKKLQEQDTQVKTFTKAELKAMEKLYSPIENRVEKKASPSDLKLAAHAKITRAVQKRSANVRRIKALERGSSDLPVQSAGKKGRNGK